MRNLLKGLLGKPNRLFVLLLASLVVLPLSTGALEREALELLEQATHGLRASNDQCLKALAALAPGQAAPPSVRTLQSILAEVETSNRLLNRLPTFSDPALDQTKAQEWQGTSGEAFFASALPPGIQFIDHSVFQPTEAGVVKNGGSGEYVNLRANVNFEGRIVGTNIGTTLRGFTDNIPKPYNKRTLVSDDAKAVIVFLHGGGTKTTGNHVGISAMNHFASLGVDVISLDMGWHGEGPREFFDDPRHYFEWLRAFVGQFISASGKDVYLAGHSMGGEFADMYRRLFPNDKVFKGVIALSSVVDPDPGSTLTSKMKQIQEMESESHAKDSVGDEDKSLLYGLVTQGKMSPMGSFFERGFALANSWTIPADGGASLIPALYIWGEVDWLYAGNERLIAQYIRTLPKTDIKTYGERRDFSGNKTSIGHLIFDHYRPGTEATIEAFADMADFIAKTSGVQLVPIKRNQIKKSDQKDPSKMDPDFLLQIARIIQTYANNLAFRTFLQGHIFQKSEVTSSVVMEFLNGRIADLQQFVRLSSSTKAADLSAEQKAEEMIATIGRLQDWENRYREAVAAKPGEQVVPSLMGLEMPSDPKAAQDQTKKLMDLRARNSLSPSDPNFATLTALREQMKTLEEATKTIRPIFDRLRKAQVEMSRDLASVDRRFEQVVGYIHFPPPAQGQGLSQNFEILSTVIGNITRRPRSADVPEVRLANEAAASMTKIREVLGGNLNSPRCAHLAFQIRSRIRDLSNKGPNPEGPGVESHLRALVQAFNAFLLAEAIERDDATSQKKILALKEEADQRLESLLAVMRQMDRAVDEYYVAQISQGKSVKNVPEHILFLFKEFESLGQKYQSGMDKLRRAIWAAMANGSSSWVPPTEFANRYGSPDIDLPTPTSLEGKFLTLEGQLQEVERVLGEAVHTKRLIEQQLAGALSGGIFTTSEHRALDVFNVPIEAFPVDRKPLIQNIWTAWQTLWRERPPAGATSLY